ncbi:MAG: hypothetical protein CMH57_00190 [Myxococcales bacterium]|nr:hypothetical protein [Myxococcales bacterium]
MTLTLNTIAHGALLAALLTLLSACGWGYAGETYKQKPDETILVDPPKPPPAATQVNTDPCLARSFTVFFMDQNSRSAKEVQCDTGRTLNLTRSDMSEAEFRRARLDNIPIGQWYLLVDPRAPNRASPNAVSNDELLGLAQIYNLSYHQRQPSTGLILYLFEDNKGTPR